MNNVLLGKQGNPADNNGRVTITWVYLGKNSEGYDHWMGVPELK